MRRLTIENKIILCFTAMFILIIAVAVPLNYIMISGSLYNNAKAQLEYEVDEIVKSANFKESTISFNVDLIDPGTYAAVYSNENELLAGEIPQDFPQYAPPILNTVHTEKSINHEWVIIDCELTNNGEMAGWLRVVKPLFPLSETIKRFRSMVLKIIPIYIVITILGLLFIRRILSPVNEITKTAKQISQGDFTKRINLDIPRDALGTLAETFDEMLDRIEHSFNQEKRFSSDVSHELRTPITAIIISAEEALDGEKTAQEYQETFEAILSEGRKISSVISQLLMMARSGDGKYVPEMDKINVSMLTKAIVDDVHETAEDNEVSISFDIEEGIIMLVEQTLYMRLLINLIDNALKYNVTGGWVKVSLKKHEDIICLFVEDSGIGISEENLPKIWDRFFKADQSSINSSPGLGLSIVKWIAELHSGTFHVKSELNKGSQFEIRFWSKQKT